MAKVFRQRFCFALLALLFLPGRAESQSQRAALTGRVTDRATGHPIAMARISSEQGRFVLSDSTGEFLFPDLPAGVAKFTVRADDFAPTLIIVELLEGQMLDRPVRLDSTEAGRAAAAQSLPAVDVTARAPAANYRLAAFEERRRTGRGQYLTEDQIAQSGAYNVADAVKSLRGVIYECGGSAEAGICHVRMSRAPMRCLPEYVVDDKVDNEFGSSVPILDIIALEVYTGPSDVPGEYAGRNAGCGVIVIWTRSGPRRAKER